MIQLREIIELRAALGAFDARRVVQVEHGIRAGPQSDALMRGRQKSAAPQPRKHRLPGILPRALRHHGDEGRQVFVFGPQPVARPRAHTGVTRKLIPCVHVGDCGVVVDRLRVQALDDANVVRDRLNIGQQVADPRAVFTAQFTRLQRRHHGIRALPARHPGEALRALDGGGNLLTSELLKRGFIIEEIDVRQTSALKQTQLALRLRREMRQARPTLALGFDGTRDTRREQRAERDATDAAGGIANESATGEMPEIVGERR